MTLLKEKLNGNGDLTNCPINRRSPKFLEILFFVLYTLIFSIPEETLP